MHDGTIALAIRVMGQGVIRSERPAPSHHCLRAGMGGIAEQSLIQHIERDTKQSWLLRQGRGPGSLNKADSVNAPVAS